MRAQPRRRCLHGDADLEVRLSPLFFWRTRSMPTQEKSITKVSATLVEALNVDEERSSPTVDAAGRPGGRVDRLPGHRLPPGARVRHQDPARRAVPRIDLPGRPRVRAERQGHRQGPGRAARRSMPFADLSEFEKNPEVSGISDLFTVETDHPLHPGQAGRYERQLVVSRQWSIVRCQIARDGRRTTDN